MDAERRREQKRRAAKKYWANLSPEKKAAYYDGQRENRNRWHREHSGNNLGPEEKQQRRERNRQATRKYLAKLTPEQKKDSYNKRRENNLEEIRAYARDWAKRKYASDEVWRKEQIEKARARYTANKDKANENRRKRLRSLTADERHYVYTLRRHGLTSKQYADMLTAQDGKCAICKTDEPGGRKHHRHLYVDHCHTTGKVRGLLCNRCNVGLSRFRDDSNLLRLAIAYLRKSLRPVRAAK